MKPWNKEQIIAQQKAANERERQIAGAYFQEAPTLSNLYNAFIHWYNSIPFLGGQPENGEIYQTGIAPSFGPQKTLTTAEKLSRAAKIQNAKSIAVRRANAAARKAAEDQKYYESFGPTREGRSVVQPVSDKVPYRYRYPDGTYESNFELSPTLQVRNTAQNYVANEAERAAAIDFLRENPGMRGTVGTTVSKDYYNPYDYTYPRTQYFNNLLQPRKTSKQVSTELDNLLRIVR